MDKKIKIWYSAVSLLWDRWKSLQTGFLFLLIMLCSTSVFAQNNHTIKGLVVDDKQVPVIGATIVLKDKPTLGTATDVNGEFSLNIPSGKQVLVISYIGMEKQEVEVTDQDYLKVAMKTSVTQLDDIIVVGYGKQKKESVVGAITQTTGEVLERAGGVSSVGAALTGNLPGVITAASTGMPGEEDPQILIRGQSTWNNANPLVLVDGVERSISSIDINSVESISVLKDASATAVFGVRGGNGVILITTKRGHVGKAEIRAAVNTTMKVPSKLPGKYDSYDALNFRNRAIENELSLSPASWNNYLPQDIINKYRNPANEAEAERYPNVDWSKELFKDYAMSYNANLDVTGGTKFVKYFASADFLREGDLFRQFNNDRGYAPGYGFTRLNVRSNLDFQITTTTTFKVNLAGSHGVKKMPWGASNGDYSYWIAAYSTAPDLFMPQYSDGTWGYYAPNEQKGLNSSRILAISGVGYTTTNRITTDFTLDQDLKMLLKGLAFKGTISLDNSFVEYNRGVNDLYNGTQSKWIDPATGKVTYQQSFDGTNRFDYQNSINWATAGGTVNDQLTFRRLFYQLQLNYGVNFGKHNITAMGLFSRNQNTTGSAIPSYREDWVFRATYNFANKYMIEYNGAYNGSEQFGPNNRFAFFSSGGASWIISQENFMKSLTFINKLKLRGSYGVNGNDNYDPNNRFLYMDQWAYGGQALMGLTGETPESSPYVEYKQTKIGNPNIRWEKVKKANIGVDFEFLKGFISGNVDFFQDKRSDVNINGGQRAIPSYFGAVAPSANLGKTEAKGYELELRLNRKLNKNLRLYANLNMTHAKDKIISMDDPELLPDYQKRAGKQIGQSYSYVSSGYYNNWDQLYASTILNPGDNQKLPGNYNIIDYNGDGVIDSKDNIPYGYPSRPQNTYNATIGGEWKGFSVFVQFYGVNNVTRQVVLTSLSGQNDLVYDQGSYWSKDNTNADTPMPRWLSATSDYNSANRYMFDGSYLRLKNAEIAYTFGKSWKWVRSVRIENVRLYLNGNNLMVWTKMPDDRESNFAGTGWASQGAYPTVKRYNLGLNITF
jgi:TonB-linked SusC/RagA family outer membrane protein